MTCIFRLTSWMDFLYRSAAYVACSILLTPGLYAQQEPSSGVSKEDSPPNPVEVRTVVEDSDIANRLTRILKATQWFENPQVEVDEGVVFLSGSTAEESHRKWAGELANKTQDVVAVVNRIEVRKRAFWDLSPAMEELGRFGAEIALGIPKFIAGVLFFILAWLLSKFAAKSARRLLKNQIDSQLLREVAARAIAVPFFLLGIYLVLRVSGLTQLAMTVLGGTGLIGLIVGFAFRDIAENFLASILISLQHPFAKGDLIEVAGFKGQVQSVNTRSTLLMTLDGNHVQVPNATIYKDTITNYTANPNARFDFSVGIGYDDSISEAQSIALKILSDHPAVAKDLESFVLVDSLGAATVNLKAYFWVDIANFSGLKVRSALIRLTKQAFDEAGISMPDEAREVVFPSGVPVTMQEGEPVSSPTVTDTASSTDAERLPMQSGEGDLSNENEELAEQGRKARKPEEGPDLLES